MKIHYITQALLLAGLSGLLLTASANAATITYDTNGAGTGFNNTSLLMLNSTTGVGATLVFHPNVNSTTGLPSNISFGTFTLTCATCTAQSGGAGAIFGAFDFNLLITDETDGASGLFVGSSMGGAVFSDVSQLNIIWAPLQLGPFGNNASSGSFGTTIFSTKAFTGIVAPNSGSVPGQSTVEGYIDFVGSGGDTVTPEPSTFILFGTALAGFGLWHRKSA